MADNVIRHDLIELEFDTRGSLKEIQKLQDEINDLKKKLSGGVGDDAFDDLKDSANDSVNPLKKVKEQAEKVTKSVTDIGKKAAVVAYNGLKKVAGISFKGLTVGIGAAATAIGKMAYESAQAFGEYEQLKGGMEKIFDQADTKKIMKDAQNAYIDLGMSANQYLSKINDTGANFASSMGDQKGYDTARTGMLAISNYASGTGKSIDLLSEKFTMITRASSSYQSIADQFSGILPATSSDFLSQAKAAGFLGKKYKKLTDVPIAEYQEAVAKMLEKGVIDLGLAGNTAAEAEGTVTGSLGMMKSAWGNLLVAIGSGENLDQAFENMMKSAEAFAAQMMPVITRALGNIGKLVEKITPLIAEKLPQLAEDLIPPLIKAAVELTKGLIKALPNIIKTLAVTIVDIFGEQFPIIKKIGTFFSDNADIIGNSIKRIIPVVLGLVAAFKGFQGLKAIGSFFGGSSGDGSGGSGGFFGGITNTFKTLAKTKPTTILKGMGNLAIILGGFMLLSAVFAAIAPAIAELSDMKSILEFASIMIVLGVVGGVLAKFASIVGAVPIPVVLTGLANMALVLVGFGALATAFGALNKIPGLQDLIRSGGELLTSLCKILGEMVGAIVGGIAEGVTKALPGIAKNIAAFAENIKPVFTAFEGANVEAAGKALLSIGEFLLLMTANDILSFFTGGNDFTGVAKGLGTLAGEGTKKFLNFVKAYPEEAFVKAEKFFKALDGISSLPNAGGLGQLFTGKNDFSGVATGLGKLAGENVKKFFTMVSGLQQVAFDNAIAFFKCLDGIHSLPNSGGLGQLFTGKNDFSGVATGLGKLAGENVKKFFTVVSTFTEKHFSNATSFFKCLSGIHSLPNSGGIGQLFAGKNDFSGVASGLKTLSGEGVKKFFTMVSGVNNETFAKTKNLFSALAGISEIGKKGFFEQLGELFGGKDDDPITKVANGLWAFAAKSKDFFTQIKEFDANKLNSLWKSLKNAGDLTTKNLADVVAISINGIVEKIKELPKRMGDALKSNSKQLSNGFISMWEAAVKASVAPVNKLLDGANHILKEFGSKKRAISWSPYAKGTDGHKGGNALVNDGRGAELVQMPNGNAFIPKGRNVLLPNAPKGMKVLSAERTARLFGKNSATFRYADGIGNLDIWNYIDNPSGLVSEITKSISYKGLSGFTANLSRSMVSTFSGEMSAWVKKLFEEEGILSLADYVASKGVAQWRSTVIRALKMEGLYSAANVKRTLYQMQTESGGNPYAINLWDSNAKKGIPSKGLMQVIDPTFKAYAREGFNKNIYDPLSNILASVRYATSRYGSLEKAYRGVGYSRGVGTVTLPEQSGSLNLSYTPENSYVGSKGDVTENNTFSPVFNLTINGTSDGRAMERHVKRWVKESMDEIFRNMSRKSPRTVEI